MKQRKKKAIESHLEQILLFTGYFLKAKEEAPQKTIIRIRQTKSLQEE